MEPKRPKWDIGVAIAKGKESLSLLQTYSADLQPRLKPDEAEQLRANVAELEINRSGQPEMLVDQKSKTEGQNEAIDELLLTISGLRRLVRSNNPPAEILKSFGVGEQIIKTVSSINTAANLVINAYNNHSAWCADAGIIEADIEEIDALKERLKSADDTQETSKFTRKSRTLDKNTLQRTVEDEVTKISALGIHIFQRKDPAVANLFAGLIPGSSGSSDTSDSSDVA